MPIWFVTIYALVGEPWTEQCGTEYTEAYRWARKRLRSRERCCFHTGNPEGRPLYEKLFGNLVPVHD